MSGPSSSAPGTASPAKQPVSPARNIIGVIVLIAVVVIGWLEYSAKAGYNAAVTAVNQRLEDEDHGLPAQTEIEEKIGKAPDDAGSDVQEGGATFAKKTYTWKGLISSYSLAAYYTKDKQPALHHIEAGEKYQPQSAPAPAKPGAGESPSAPSAASFDPTKRLEGKGKADTKAAPAAPPKAEEKPKAGADEKDKAPEPKAEEKPKAGADEKAKAPAKAD